MQAIIHNGSHGSEPGACIQECRHVRPWIRSLRGVVRWMVNTGNRFGRACSPLPPHASSNGGRRGIRAGLADGALRSDKRRA